MLGEDDREPAPDVRPEPAPGAVGASVGEPAAVCPEPGCGRPLPAADAWVCPHCLAELPVAGADVRVELSFATGTVVVRPGAEAVLGRNGTHRSAEVLDGLCHVSRRHAGVRVDEDGSAWVRDAGSTNGTFIDADAVGPKWVRLVDGAVLRLDHTACVVRYVRSA
jgi:hypothetical protein